MKSRYYLIILIGALVCTAAAAALLLMSRPRRPRALYKVTFIPSLGGFLMNPHSLNEAGQVVGVAETPTRTQHIFLWDKQQGFRKLGRYDEPPHAGRLCINNVGQIAGTTSDSNGHRRAFFRDVNEDQRQMLGTFGGHHAVAQDLNDKGQIVGYAENAALERRAFLWDPNSGMRDIGTLGGDQCVALRVNEAGQIVGWSLTKKGTLHLFLWDPVEGMTDLGPSGSGPAHCYINNNGFVVRRFGTTAGKTYFATWTKETGARELDFVGVESAEPCALNDADRFLIRGKPAHLKLLGRSLRRRQECYLWDPNDGIIPLQPRVPIPDLTYLKVTDINNKGCITAIIRTKDADLLRAVFLEPAGG
jgi:probable HAF family extracellular repeat protein